MYERIAQLKYEAEYHSMTDDEQIAYNNMVAAFINKVKIDNIALWTKLYGAFDGLTSEAIDAIVAKFSDYADYINKKIDERVITIIKMVNKAGYFSLTSDQQSVFDYKIDAFTTAR